jgi:hypothetical protein
LLGRGFARSSASRRICAGVLGGKGVIISFLLLERESLSERRSCRTAFCRRSDTANS